MMNCVLSSYIVQRAILYILIIGFSAFLFLNYFSVTITISSLSFEFSFKKKKQM